MNKNMNGLLEKMMDEALDEVVKKGWKQCDPQTITIACYRLLIDKVKSQMKPIWWLAAAVGSGVIWSVVNITIFN